MATWYEESVLLASDLPVWLVRCTAFMFGAVWGSFFNVAIYRWPREMSVVSPPSHCPACGAPVRWYLNLPIFGYLLLRGKARCCGAPMTARYVWVEAISGVLCLALFERMVVDAPRMYALPAVLQALLYFAFVGGLIIATFVDLEWIEIPDEVSLPGTALGLCTVSYRQAPGALEAAVGAGLGFLIVQVLFVWLYELATGRRGMGEGDAKLLMMIGAFVGWEGVLFCLVAGSLQGLVAAAVLRVTGRPLVPERPDLEAEIARAHGEAPPSAPESDTQGAQTEAPDEAGAPMMVFGPLLALSAIEYLFFGDALVGFYLRLLGAS